MFGKLLKHEFKAVRGILSILSLAALGAGIVGGLLLWLMTHQFTGTGLDNELQIAYITTTSIIAIGGIYLGLLAYVVGSAIVLYYRFYRSKFSDEGYLTFTLPVSTHKILLSSMLNIFIWEIIVSAVTILSFLIMFMPVIVYAYQSGDIVSPFSNMSFILSSLGFDTTDVLGEILTIISSWIYGLVLPLTAITLGSLAAKKHKILASIGIGYGISLAVSMVSGIFSVYSMINGAIYSGGEMSSDTALNLMMYTPAVLQLGIGIGGYFLMHHLIKKKLNLP